MDIEVRMPEIGTDLVEVIEILVKIGDLVNKNDSLITVEGQKASVEVPSPCSGVIKNIIVNIGNKIRTNTLIAVIQNSSSLKSEINVKPDLSQNIFNKNVNLDVNKNINSNVINKGVLVHASPSVRRLARQLHVELENITGCGRKSRILKEDVLSYKKSLYKKENKNTFKDDINFDLQNSVVLTNVQKKSSENLLKSWLTIPHVTQFDESDITELEKFRKHYNSNLEDNNKRLTVLVFIIKAVAKALEIFPKFNSRLLTKDDTTTLIINKHINIGIAVDTENGLLVPIINDVNHKNISDLSIELIFASRRARAGKLNLSDVNGNSSFTISNLGGIGGRYFTPIINYPELAILGVSKASIKPCWSGKQFVPKLFLPLSLSYDHRAIDGAEAVRFIIFINKMLSDIRLLMM